MFSQFRMFTIIFKVSEQMYKYQKFNRFSVQFVQNILDMTRQNFIKDCWCNILQEPFKCIELYQLGVKRSYFYNYGEKERVLLKPLCVYLNIWNTSDYLRNCVKSQCCYLRLGYPEPVMYSLQTNKIRLESDRNNIVYTHIRQHLVHYTTQPTYPEGQAGGIKPCWSN